jgi:hypothetical protein
MNDLSKEEYEKLFDADFETGILKWKTRLSLRTQIGANVGTKNHRGYITTSINRKIHSVHRIILIMAGIDIFEKEVDHINHKRDDNRLINLRAVENHDSKKNYPLRKDNTSGYVGIIRKTNKWVARIYVDKKQIHLGVFLDKKEAISARKTANIKYGFHENHGEYSV